MSFDNCLFDFTKLQRHQAVNRSDQGDWLLLFKR